MKKEIHHKVPTFLGGSDEDWNKERITVRQHLLNHLEIAKELDTLGAWACCTALMTKAKAPRLLIDLIKRRFGKCSSIANKGKENGMYGKPAANREMNPMDHFMYGTTPINNTMFKGFYVSPNTDKYSDPFQAAREYSVSKSTIYRWSKKNLNGWSFEPIKE